MSPVTSASRSTPGPNSIPVFERQVLPSQTLRELRVACALIVKETGPSGAELDAILNQPDPLDTYNKEVAKVRAKASATQQSAFTSKGFRPKDRASKSNLASANQSSTTLPLDRPRSNVYTSNHRSTSALPQNAKPKVEPVPVIKPVPAEKQITRKSVPKGDHDALSKIRSSINARPKTSAAASVDYMAGTAGSSGSTTRSNTTFEPRGVNTNATSLNQTPADDKRTSYAFPKRSSSRVTSAQGWHAEDLSHPNPDYSTTQPQHARNAPAQSISSQAPSRPRSRASSIKSSIFSGLRDYIQPRPSMESLTRNASRNSSRPPSRGSNFSQSSRGWLKNAANGLRRKGSFSSWRSNRPEDEDRGRAQSKTPDLNRSLPPLPGLDSYKEPKVHIAQMLTKSPPPAQPVPPQITPKTNSALSPRSPGQKSSSSPGHASAQNIARSYPRIPFSDADASEFPQPPSATSSTFVLQSPKERQMRETERRRQRQERHKEASAKSPKERELEKQQEEEVRQMVRERIMRGGLSKEAFNAEEVEISQAPLAQQQQLQQPQQHPASHPSRSRADRVPMESEKKRQRHKKLEREANMDSESPARRSRISRRIDGVQDLASSPKRTLKSRLSRLIIRHDHNLEHGQGNAIIAN